MAQQEDVFKKIVSHAKEYGFVFPSSEIYDGLSAVYDYGQNGVELKNNIKRYWWDAMTLLHEHRRHRLGHIHAPHHMEGFRPRRRVQRPPD